MFWLTYIPTLRLELNLGHQLPNHPSYPSASHPNQSVTFMNILTRINIRIYSYQKFDTNECPNTFVKEKLIRTNVRIYIRDQYIRIFEYSNIFVTLCIIAHPVNGLEPEMEFAPSLSFWLISKPFPCQGESWLSLQEKETMSPCKNV